MGEYVEINFVEAMPPVLGRKLQEQVVEQLPSEKMPVKTCSRWWCPMVTVPVTSSWRTRPRSPVQEAFSTFLVVRRARPGCRGGVEKGIGHMHWPLASDSEPCLCHARVQGWFKSPSLARWEVMVPP